MLKTTLPILDLKLSVDSCPNSESSQAILKHRFKAEWHPIDWTRTLANISLSIFTGCACTHMFEIAYRTAYKTQSFEIDNLIFPVNASSAILLSTSLLDPLLNQKVTSSQLKQGVLTILESSVLPFLYSGIRPHKNTMEGALYVVSIASNSKVLSDSVLNYFWPKSGEEGLRFSFEKIEYDQCNKSHIENEPDPNTDSLSQAQPVNILHTDS